jgi:4-amino-4-deoxy-L-arabinose transferase-like glycosyltransferase
MIVATGIFAFHKEEFFGGDANTYDDFGDSLLRSWAGDTYHLARYNNFVQAGGSAWGMLYIVAFVYQIVGRNLFAIQLLNASIGSATAAVVYYNAKTIFSNERVSRISAALVCFFPSLVLWSSQALKDGLIVLTLSLAILATLKLLERVTVGYILLLTGCLFGLLSLRFYIFYMMAAAVIGSFVIGMKSMNSQSFVGRFVAVAFIGLALTWFGVLRYATAQFDTYGTLKMIQTARQDQAMAGSGFGQDLDVGTAGGALTAIPQGLVYLLFAPFPWQVGSARQSLALPEMIVWWLCFPLLILGIWYSMKHRLLKVSPIFLFTTMLTLAYSVFQGNVGTAYRQRSQLLVFYLIFVAVGAVLLKERAEDRQRMQLKAKQDLAELQAARARARRTTTPEFDAPESMPRPT